MIDTHAHLDFPEFDEDRKEVILRAFDNGVKKIINIGVDLERSRKSIEIAEKYEGVFASVGIHPNFFSQGSTFLPPTSRRGSSRLNLFLDLKKISKHEKVVAIGETGLDYYHVTRSTQHATQEKLEEIKENQKKGFLAQIEIARELGLPVIVHCRENADSADLGGGRGGNGAWEDLYKIISKFSQSSAFPFLEQSSRNFSKPSFSKFVLHCYSGEKKDTEKFLELPNVYFSFSGNITYPRPADRADKLAEAVRMIPLERMMLDSDAPFLAPQEFRGKRNEPSYVKYIAQKIAEVKNISVSEVEKVTDENACCFFNLGD